MTIGSEFADDLKHEVLCEMADSFFSRRCRLDERLENFESLRKRVISRSAPAVDAVHTLRRLLLDHPGADAFLASLGLDPAALPPVKQLRPIARPMALTAAGRYRKAVRRAYETMQREIKQYNDGGYTADPRQPGRMMPVPGYDLLHSVAEKINAEIEAINACQSPSDMLRFTKSLDPAGLEQASACGVVGDACRINDELAFTRLDPDHFGVPHLPTPPAPDAMEALLDELADNVRASDPNKADAVFFG
ncbi:hypothetical protein [Desulfovibrio sp. TomC]|uniref:hypothetical protein n=1 Tax=Desulfovibrio sp. TomC TaxID=1562888 RepID=UPI000575400D|nr:hypothetical protein [Desulfovibrio sp. TomC]KHK01384.1 hypothetical protein NY78_3138 [Desulfovibrio sp. TomC]